MENSRQYEVDRVLLLVFGLMFINAFLELPLPLGGTLYIPSFYLLICAGILFLKVKKDFGVNHYIYAFGITVFSIFSAFLAPNYNDLSSRLFASLQMCTSAVVFLVTISAAKKISQEKREIVFLFLLALIFALTFLEYFGVTTTLSDSFRDYFYTVGDYSAYSEEWRDVILLGNVRPKVFTSEPSLVAIGFFVLTSSILLSTKRNSLVLLVLVLNILENYFLGSPIVLLGFFVFLLRIYFISRIGIGPFVIATIFLSAVGGVFIDDRLIERFSNIDAFFDRGGETIETQSSENLRLINPYLSAIDSISANPLTGLGIGGKRSLNLYSTNFSDYVVAFGSNAFASIFIFFGFFGSLAFFTTYLKLLRRVIFVSGLSFVAVFLLMQTMGGFESARFWFYVALLFASRTPEINLPADRRGDPVGQ